MRKGDIIVHKNSGARYILGEKLPGALWKFKAYHPNGTVAGETYTDFENDYKIISSFNW